MASAIRDAAQAAERLRFPASFWCTPFLHLVSGSRCVSASPCRNLPELNISPNGDVLLCDILDDVLANVRDDGVLAAWRKQEEHPVVRALAQPELREPCTSCPIRKECLGGCFARAQLMAGDIYAPDPLCPRVEAGRRRRENELV